ncbi:acyl-CoA thioesterase [Rhodobacter sp. Har01]|uniref:acyl-CoA thioesterase n=1 Tax=Rhodobacter sp. Har01 TaxID=2883999 RepID=UPI001D06CFD9|nr:acyl-CoA thioesterase [Rhodobacter sp. Har01]MCB6177727.1 acyl-CoA thioesterase [Rhodobacter sp. Har01]
MYPYLRMFKEILKFRQAPPLGAFDTHVSHHLCWPWDIDPWMELNNGRTLTLYDLGRLPMIARVGLDRVARDRGWGLAVAGASVRYRGRIKTFDRIEMRTRMVGWDGRFVYVDQTMWVRGECASQALIRTAITQGKRGIVPPAEMAVALGLAADSPPLPGWVAAWADADALRPWPPVG